MLACNHQGWWCSHPCSHLRIWKLRFQELVAWKLTASELQIQIKTFWPLVQCPLLFATHAQSSLDLDAALGKVLSSSSFCSSSLEMLPNSNQTVVKGQVWPNSLEQRFWSWSTPPHSHILICTERIVLQGHLCSNLHFRVHLYSEKTVFGICKVQQSISRFHHWHLF